MYMARKNRRNITRPMLDRIIYIHNRINSGRYPNTKTLRDEYRELCGYEKLGIATISRDLAYLRDNLMAPLEFDRFRNGYFYTEPYSLPVTTCSAGDFTENPNTKFIDLENPAEIIIEFHGDDRKRVREAFRDKDQIITDDDEKDITEVKFSSKHFVEIPDWIVTDAKKE